MVDLGIGECLGASNQVIGISPDIMSLRLNCIEVSTETLSAPCPRLWSDLPSEKLLMATLRGLSARYSSVAFSAPSRIIICKTMRDLKTIVHVESRNRNCRVRKISPTPASPLRVATRMCSMYFDFGGASCEVSTSQWLLQQVSLVGVDIL